MRICFIAPGAFAHIGPYLEHFQEAGHEVHFLALSPSPPRSVRVHDLSLGGAYSSKRGKWKYPLSMLRARALIKALAPDVVHAHYATSGGLAGLVCGFHPTIVTAHGTDLAVGARSPVWRPLLGRIFAHADCVNTVSEDLKAAALSLGVCEEKISVLSPGVNMRRFYRREAPPSTAGGLLKLVCTRRLEAVYDPLTIVTALGELKRLNVPFRMTFAGAGSLREPAQALAARLGLSAHVTFLGEVSGDCMPGVLREHDVYLSASLRDGTSLSLLEAMSTGLFPVVSRIQANEAWLAQGAGGLLHAPGDAADLAACVLRFTREPGLAGPAAVLNRARAAAGGDRDENMRRLERIFERLARPSARHKPLSEPKPDTGLSSWP